MSTIGSPILTSLLQVAQAQQVVSKARDRERRASDQTRRFQDLVDLHVAGLETAEAVRDLSSNDPNKAEPDHQAPEKSAQHETEEDQSQLDVTA